MPQDAPATVNHAVDLSGPDKRTLMRLFQHPLTHNLSLRDAMGLFDALGSASIQHNGDIYFQLDGDALTMKRPRGKDLTATEVMDLRHLLARKGRAPDGAAQDPATVSASDLVIIIDHAGARVHALGGTDEHHHLLHEINRTQHDADREEHFPADLRFFEEVAQAVVGARRIVLIGHGKGQSNEADHLSDYLHHHHKDIRAKIVKKIVADLAHLKLHELLDLGRQALIPADDGSAATIPQQLTKVHHDQTANRA
jgi:hypothetical protein